MFSNSDLVNIRDLFKKINDTGEFEIMFNNYKTTNKLSIINFNDISQFIKYKEVIDPTTKISNLIFKTSLDISYNISQSTNYRITIDGIDSINNFMNYVHQRNNSVIFSTLLSKLTNKEENEKDEYKYISKIKDNKNIIDFNEYDIRIRLSQEVPLQKTDLSKINRQDHSDSSKITFRFKQRLSLFLLNDPKKGILRIDATIVKTSYTPDKIHAANKEFEIELEYTKGSDPLDYKICDRIIEEIIEIKQVLVGSYQIMKNSEIDEILTNYKKLVYKSDTLSYTNLYSMQPISAEVQHFIDNIPNSYSATEKTDGEKYQIFVYNNTIYLLSNNLNVIKTNYQYNVNNTIFEGEILKINKLYLFMIYDCIYHNNEEVKNNPILKERLLYIDTFINYLKIPQYKILDFTEKKFDLKNQEKHYGDEIEKFYSNLNSLINKGNNNDIIFYKKLFLFPTGADDSEIYSFSDMIWKKCTDENIQCPYFIDGIIYTPINQKYTKDNKEQKNKIFKYKPPDMNSIDVYITFKKKEGTNGFLEVYDNTLNCFNNNKLFRVTNLYVGDNIGSKEVPIPFMKEENNNIAYFPIDRDEVRDLEGNLVNNESVIELSYNNDINIPHQYRWTILKTRWDKTESVLRYKKKYGNYKETAIKIWKSMREAITIDEIKNLSNPEIYTQQKNLMLTRMNYKIISQDKTQDKYYQKTTDLGSFRPFHNFIKSIIIYNYANQYTDNKSNNIGKDVLDIGCGRGGDINKWNNARVKNYVGTDPNYEGLFGFIDSATIRYKDNMKIPNFTKMKFIQADSTIGFDVDTQEKIFTKMTAENKKLLMETFNNNTKFDIISYQFSIHYLFQTEKSVNNLVDINNKYLKNGGYVLCTLLDPNLLLKLLNNKDTYTYWYIDEKGNRVKFFEIKKTFTGDIKDTYNQGISIYMSWISQEDTYLHEFLVTKTYLENIMKKSKCLLVDWDYFSNVYSANKEWFTTVIQHEENPKNKTYYSKIAKFYGELKDTDRESKIWSDLFVYYVFKKYE